MMSRENLSSFSSFVTSIGTIVTVTRRGLGRCEYQFQVHAAAQIMRKEAIIAAATRRGRVDWRRLQPAASRLSQGGRCQETSPKIWARIRRKVAATADLDRANRERSGGVFMRGIRPAPRKSFRKPFLLGQIA